MGMTLSKRQQVAVELARISIMYALQWGARLLKGEGSRVHCGEEEEEEEEEETFIARDP